MSLNRITRRDFLRTSAVGASGILTVAANGKIGYGAVKKMRIYVGTYTSGGAEGIYLLDFDTTTGELTKVKTIKDVIEPSFLTTDSNNRFLYAVNETVEYEGKPSGAVSAFKIEEDGDLKFINKVPSLGGAPCHIVVSENNKFVLVANYVGGNAAVFPVRADGGLGEHVELIQHTGHGPNKDRQEAAHVHSVNPDRKNGFVLICDLGLDQVGVYKFDTVHGKLILHSTSDAKPGTGPRHIVFSADEKFVYTINEMGGTISVSAYDEKAGTLKEAQSVSTLPEHYRGPLNTTAEIAVSPSGKFLYGSNRGDDSIVSYSIDKETGKLTFVERVPSGGKGPRNFIIEPTGKFLIAANQYSENIVVFAIEEKTGLLLMADNKPIEIPAPVCLHIVSK